MKKIVFVSSLVLLLTKSTFCQFMTKGIVHYTLIVQSNAQKFNDLPKVMTLYFSNNEFLYVQAKTDDFKDEEIEDKNSNDVIIRRGGATLEKPKVYINVKSKTLFSNEPILGKDFSVQEVLPKISWKLFNDRKQIGSFSCQKASAIYKNRTYTVWFTTSIPVKAGPWKLWGLPGLILEANSDDKEVIFKFHSIELGKSLSIFPIKQGSKIYSSSEFSEFRKKRLSDIKHDLESKSIQGNVVIELNKFSIDNYPN